MKFNLVLGNPPYQGINHLQIYPYFYLSSLQLGLYVCLIFPNGWQKAKDANNLNLLNNEKVKEDTQIISIQNLKNVFVEAKDTNIILWKHKYDNNLHGRQYINSKIKKLPMQMKDIEKPQEIIELANIVTQTEDFKPLQISKSKPYGLRKDVFHRYDYYGLQEMSVERTFTTDITVYGSKGEIRYISIDYKLPKITNNFDKYKIFVSSSWGDMDGRYLGGAWSNIILALPYELCTETYQEIGGFNEYRLAKYHAKYLMTIFVRALIYRNKQSQMSTRAWGAVPMQDYLEDWWDEPIEQIEDRLFDKYNIPQKIRVYVKENIQEKSERNIINYDGI